uniref:BCL-11A-like CCHC zinc finger domain-containing protein n=1 Tax=Petromyzon marinus TaxID=7757 RepID=S4RJG4_PETMA
EQDLLTCGQCQLTFPLADILLFIQHKRKGCEASLCADKGPGGGAGGGGVVAGAPRASPPAHALVRAPVDIGVQVSPEDDDLAAGHAKGGPAKREGPAQVSSKKDHFVNFLQ